MLPEERARLIALLIAGLTVYGGAVALGIRWARQGHRGLRVGLVELWLRRTTFALSVLGIVCFAYAFLIEPYWVDVARVQVQNPRVDAPIRIVHLSDIHSDPEARLEERLPALVREQHPDLIVFTGDSLNSPQGLPVFRKCMTALAQVAPTIAVRGNWDVWYWPDLDLFGETGVQEVANSATTLRIRDQSVWVAGLAVDAEAGLAELMKTAPSGALKVLLHHYPDEVYQGARLGVDLYLAGHTHGGQVALPFYGALVTFSKFGKRFERGLHRVGATWLYVNRGIGMEGGIAPRVRFFSRPEVTVLDLVPAQGPDASLGGASR